jgi:hypothetical protein
MPSTATFCSSVSIFVKPFSFNELAAKARDVLDQVQK